MSFEEIEEAEYNQLVEEAVRDLAASRPPKWFQTLERITEKLARLPNHWTRVRRSAKNRAEREKSKVLHLIRAGCEIEPIKHRRPLRVEFFTTTNDEIRCEIPKDRGTISIKENEHGKYLYFHLSGSISQCFWTSPIVEAHITDKTLKIVTQSGQKYFFGLRDPSYLFLYEMAFLRENLFYSEYIQREHWTSISPNR